MTETVRGPRKLWGLSVTRALGLVLVPVVTVGVFLWGLWNPVERLGTVRAAVVNLDEPVDVDGQLTPLGRVLAAELIGDDSNENFAWVLTDEEDARAGLDDGRYITVVTIPENFSAAATSMSGGPAEAEQAHITIDTSERAKLLDAALASAVTETAMRMLSEQLGSAVVSNVVVGMTSLGGGIDEVQDGAEQLTQGIANLEAGLSEFASGTDRLAAGINELSAGANELAEGLRMYAAGVDEYAAGAGAAAAGSHVLAGGVHEYTETVNAFLIPILDTLTEQSDLLRRLRDFLATEELPLTEEQREQVLGVLDQMMTAPAGMNQLIAGGQDLAAGAQAQAGGLDELATGAGNLAAGAHGLAAGTGELATGMGLLAAELPGLVDGAYGLAAGAEEITSGSSDLAEGIGQIANEIPRYTDAEAARFAELALNPVTAGDDRATLFSGTGAPLFLTVALWIGALSSFLLLTPLWPRTRVAARNELWITLRSARPAVTLGALQGLTAGVFVAVMLGLPFASAVALWGFSILTGVAFALVNQGLVALFRGPGRFVAFVVAGASLVSGIVSTAPAVLETVVSVTPIGSAMHGLHGIVEGGEPAIASTILTVLWAAGGLILIGGAVHRARKTLA